MTRYALLFINSLGILLASPFFFVIHKVPFVSPAIIEKETNGYARDQLVSQLADEYSAIYHAANLMWVSIYCWIALAVLNIAVLLIDFLRNKQNTNPNFEK